MSCLKYSLILAQLWLHLGACGWLGIKGSKAFLEPRKASRVKLPAMSAVKSKFSIFFSSSSPTAVITWQPLISDRPSLACRTKGEIPVSFQCAFSRITASVPSLFQTSPSPIKAKAKWDKGAKITTCTNAPLLWNHRYQIIV